jgi:hypothetical protein
MATAGRGQTIASRARAASDEDGGDEREALRQAVAHLVQEMEEPLREAFQFIRVVGLIDPCRDEDWESVSAVAMEASARLRCVTNGWRGLVDLCRREEAA